MIRRWIAASLSLAIPVAALCAPLVHAHPDHHDADHHHGSPVVHAHVSPHAGAGARHRDVPSDAPRTFTVRDDDGEHAVWLQAYVAVPPPLLDVPAATLVSITLTAAPEALGHRPVEVLHAHDPPLLAAAPPRAPPAFLS